MKTVLTICLAFVLTSTLVQSQVGNGIPFDGSVDESCSGCSTTVTVNPTDPAIYDRRHDKFIIGDNWGHHGSLHLNRVMGLNLVDQYFTFPAQKEQASAFPQNTRIIPVYESIGEIKNFWNDLTWGWGTRTDPELDRNPTTGFGILRSGDKTGAIRTCRRHDDVEVLDSIIRLDPAVFDPDIESIGQLVLWDNQNSGVMYYHNIYDYRPDHNGSRIWVTVLLRHDGDYDEDALDDKPVLTLNLKGGLLWRPHEVKKHGSANEATWEHSNSGRIYFTDEGNKRQNAKAKLASTITSSDNLEDPLIDPNDEIDRHEITKPRYVDDQGVRRIIPGNGPFGMKWNEIVPLYFRSVPIIGKDDGAGAATAFPVNKPKGMPGLVKGYEWNTLATAGEAPFLPIRNVETITYDNAGLEIEDPDGCPERLAITEGYPNTLFENMTITQGMLKRLPRASGSMSQWVSFSALVEFRPYVATRIENGRRVPVSWEQDEEQTRIRLENPNDPSPSKVTRYSNPFLREANAGDGTRVSDILLEVRYHGQEKIDIDWVSFETPNMRKMLKEELREDLAKAVANIHSDMLNTSTELGEAQANRNLRILGLRTEEEDGELIWMSQRYLHALMRGNVITEDLPEPFNYWRHMVVSDYSTYELESKPQPIWWWISTFSAPNNLVAAPFKRNKVNIDWHIPNGDPDKVSKQNLLHARRTGSTNADLGIPNGVEGVISYNYSVDQDLPALSVDHWSPRHTSRTSDDYINSLYFHEISAGADKTYGTFARRDGRYFSGHASTDNVSESILVKLAKGRGSITNPGVVGISRSSFIDFYLEHRNHEPLLLSDLEPVQGGVVGSSTSLTHHVFVSSVGAATHPSVDMADVNQTSVFLPLEDWSNYDAPYLLRVEREMYKRLADPFNNARFYDGSKILQQIWMETNCFTNDVGKIEGMSIREISALAGNQNVRPAEIFRYDLGFTIMTGCAGVMPFVGNNIINGGGLVFNGFANGRRLRNDHADPLAFLGPTSHEWLPRTSSGALPTYADDAHALRTFLEPGAGSRPMHPTLGGDYSLTLPSGDGLTVNTKTFNTSFPSMFLDINNGLLQSGGSSSTTINTLVVDVTGRATYRPTPQSPLIDPYGLRPDETTGVATKDLFIGHYSKRRELAHFGQALLQKVPSLDGGHEEQTWQTRLAELRLASWYGKGYVDLWSHDEARYGSSDPLRDIVDVEKVRTRHPYRWLRHESEDRSYGNGNGGDDGTNGEYAGLVTELRKNYEAWDSSFYDVTVLRRDPMGDDNNVADDFATEFYLCVANRRVTPIIIGEADEEEYPHGRWEFTTPVEMGMATSNSLLATKPYAQIGSREVTLPFKYVDSDGNAKLFRLTELNMALTMPIGEAQFATEPGTDGRTLIIDNTKPWRGLDTVVSSTGELAVNLLPGEMKMFRVTVSPAAKPLQIGSLALSTQS